MKYIKYFKESDNFKYSLWYDVNLYDSPGSKSIEDFRSKINKKIPIDNRDFENLSNFFEDRYPNVEYSRGYNEFIKKFKSTWGQYKDFFSNHVPINSLDDNNSFVVSFNTNRTMTPGKAADPQWVSRVSHLILVLKTDDDYFLVLEKQHFHEWGSDSARGFICDDVEGLLDFFDVYIKSSDCNEYPAGGPRSWAGSNKSNWN